MYGHCPVCAKVYGMLNDEVHDPCIHMEVPNHRLSLPKVNHKLLETNLTPLEKVSYIKNRCCIAQYLHIGETAPEYFNAIRIIHALNHKIEEGK